MGVNKEGGHELARIGHAYDNSAGHRCLDSRPLKFDAWPETTWLRNIVLPYTLSRGGSYGIDAKNRRCPIV
jgi:hypothetical protein